MTEELVLKNSDILERLKATTKINGAYPRDIADAIKEIEELWQWRDDVFNVHPNIDLEIDYYYKGYSMCS